MKKQISNAISLLVIVAFSLITLACQNISNTGGSNGANTNSASENGNAANTNSGAPVSNVNSSSDGNNSAADSPADGKLAQNIVGKWEGKNPQGEKVGLDFRADNKVYAMGEGASKEPATYEIVDEKTVKLTTPDTTESFMLTVEGNKMTADADVGKVELTKVN